MVNLINETEKCLNYLGNNYLGLKSDTVKTIEEDGDKLSKQTKVSIIIRTKDEEDWLKPCLQAIQAQEFEDARNYFSR